MQSLWQYFRTFTVPSFATTGARIVLDGVSGTLRIYNSSNQLTVQMGGADGSIIDLSSTVFAKLVNGALLLGKIVGGVPDTTNAANFEYVPGGVDFTALNSHLAPASSLNDAMQILIGPGAAGLAPPQILLIDKLRTATVQAIVSGAWVFGELTGVAATWQTPTATGGYTVTTLQYRRDAEDNVHWAGEIVQTTGVTGANGATVTTAVPAEFRPTKTWVVPAAWISTTSVAKGAAVFFVNSSGTLVLAWPSSTANGDKFSFNAKIPLGNIA